MHGSFGLSGKPRPPTPSFISTYGEAEALKHTTDLSPETYYSLPYLFPPLKDSTFKLILFRMTRTTQ